MLKKGIPPLKCAQNGPGTPPACSVVGTLLKLRLRRHLPAPGFHSSFFENTTRIHPQGKVAPRMFLELARPNVQIGIGGGPVSLKGQAPHLHLRDLVYTVIIEDYSN